jgi:hypothetical protein
VLEAFPDKSVATVEEARVGCLLLRLVLVLLLLLLLTVVCGIELLVDRRKAHIPAGCWPSLLVTGCFPSLLRLLTPLLALPTLRPATVPAGAWRLHLP